MYIKKVIISSLVAASIAYAQPYKIFVESFGDPNNPLIESTYSEVVNAMKGYKDLRVVKRPSGKYFVVVVETITDENSFNDIYSKIKSMPGHQDAFWLPAPELLSQKDGLNNNNTAIKEQTPIVEEVEPGEVRKVDTQSAMISKSENPGKSMSLPQTIELLLDTNPAIQQRVYSYMEVGKDLDISNRAFYPTLDLSASIGMGRDKANIGSRDGGTGWYNSVTKQAELRFVQKLYDGGMSSSNIDQQKARMRNASYLVIQGADRTSLLAIDAYLNVIKEKALLDLSAENIVTLEDIYDRIKERTDKGYGRLSQKQQAASRLTLAQSNFIAQQNAYDDSLSSFQRLTGAVVDAEQLSYPEFIYTLPSDINSIEQQAMMCNPAIRAEEANVELAKSILKGSNSEFLPKLNLEAFASWQDKRNYAYNNQRIDSYGALLRLNYNFFNKGIDMITKEKRQVVIQKEEEVLKGKKDELRESLQFSWQSYVLNNKKLGYVSDHARFSKETLDSYREEFKIGRRDLISVLDAENEYYNARKELISVEKDILYSKYRLLDNMGILTDSFKPGFGQSYIKDACSLESIL